ncbi:MAG: hypothetical protein WD004_03695 [Actinomycetota bacterium]
MRSQRALGTALVLAALLLPFVFGWRFLADPTLTAPARDPAWYTWRSRVIAEDSPAAVIGDWGPDQLLSGGYRITTPTVGAVLEETLGIDRYTFASMVMVGFPVLVGLTLAGFVYRVRRDRGLALITMLVSAGLCFSASILGYIDVLMSVFFFSVALAFLEPARRSWGARIVIALAGFVGVLVVPNAWPAAVLLLGSAFVWHLILARGERAATWRRDRPGLLSAAAGYGAGVAATTFGIWGRAVIPVLERAPEPTSLYRERLGEWLWSLMPYLTIPLITAGAVWVVATARRERLRTPLGPLAIVVWIVLAVVTVGGAAFGAHDPVFWFQISNPTLPVMVLAAIGLWMVAAWLSEHGRTGLVAAVAVPAIAIGFLTANLLSTSGWSDPGNQWMNQEARAEFAAANAIIERLPDDRPIIFINDYAESPEAYAWAKTHADMTLAGVGGEAARRTYLYFGTVNDFRLSRSTPSDDPYYANASTQFFDWSRHAFTDYGGRQPIVFIASGLNPYGDNNELIGAGAGVFFGVAPDHLGMVVADGSFTTPSAEVLAEGRAAYERAAAGFDDPRDPLEDLGHSLWVVLLIALMLVAPGLKASGSAGLDDWVSKLLLVPAISVTLITACAIVIAALTRSGPFGPGKAWLAVAAALVLGAAAWVVNRRLARRPAPEA